MGWFAYERRNRRKWAWFRFIVPADAAEAYVNYELTGQALLDRSIVLVNDSRIELRLQ